MTKEQIMAKFDELIDEIVDAERQCADAAPGRWRAERDEAKAVRARVMDALLDIYIGVRP